MVKVVAGGGVSSGFPNQTGEQSRGGWLRSNLRPRLIMVAWSYVWLTADFASNVSMSMSGGGNKKRSLTVTLNKAQYGMAVPWGMVAGYLNKLDTFGSAERRQRKKETHCEIYTLVQAAIHAVHLDEVVSKGRNGVAIQYLTNRSDPPDTRNTPCRDLKPKGKSAQEPL